MTVQRLAHTDLHRDRQTDKQTHRETGGLTDRQRQTEQTT